MDNIANMEFCAKICATSILCDLWIFSDIEKKCYMYFQYNELHNSNYKSVAYGAKDCFEIVYGPISVSVSADNSNIGHYRLSADKAIIG